MGIIVCLFILHTDAADWRTKYMPPDIEVTWRDAVVVAIEDAQGYWSFVVQLTAMVACQVRT